MGSDPHLTSLDSHPSFLQNHNNYKGAIPQKHMPHFPNSDYYSNIKAKYVEKKGVKLGATPE